MAAICGRSQPRVISVSRYIEVTTVAVVLPGNHVEVLSGCLAEAENVSKFGPKRLLYVSR